MSRRLYAQRKHIVESLDTLLHQLHTLSFFLAPSVLGLVCRYMLQFHCRAPRDWESNQTLLFSFWPIFILNLFSIYTHATEGAGDGKPVILDFVGLSNTPSKLQLLILDAIIVSLQLLLTTIAYEISLPENPDKHDPLSSPSFAPEMHGENEAIIGDKAKTPMAHYALDLRWSLILKRLRHRPPVPRQRETSPHLPLPNTTPWPLSTRMLMMDLGGDMPMPGGSANAERTRRNPRRG